MRVIVLEFLDTDVYQVSKENCAAFIDPLVESWDVDLESFRLEIRLNGSLVADPHHTFTFVESTPGSDSGDAAGLADFLDDSRLSGDATEEEVRLLCQQRLGVSGILLIGSRLRRDNRYGDYCEKRKTHVVFSYPADVHSESPGASSASR